MPSINTENQIAAVSDTDTDTVPNGEALRQAAFADCFNLGCLSDWEIDAVLNELLPD